MATLTIHLPDDKHTRLKELAKISGMSVNELIEELSMSALVEFDAINRFKAMAGGGNPQEGLRLLAKLDFLLETDE
ncbi:MAG: hypothetical protein N5P05_002625 [Chroococcopsis gigantea SAG 12.99]|jgi:predicted transcriptional regulator|nr:hypothetical protein [Chroococcopsis gigantea SAG 12.99]